MEVKKKTVRWIAKSEIKLSIMYKTFRKSIFVDQPLIEDCQFLTIYLRYHDGHWTTMAVHSNEPNLLATHLERVIDEAAEE